MKHDPKFTQKLGSINWMQEASKKELDLSSILYQDKNSVWKNLDMIRLPRPKIIFSDGYLPTKKEISDFITDAVKNLNGGWIYPRFQPKSQAYKKYGVVGITDYDQFDTFLRGVIADSDSRGTPFNVKNYEFTFVQNAHHDYSGIIISDYKTEHTIGELVRGHGDLVQYGLAPTLNISVGPFLQNFVINENHLMRENRFTQSEKELLMRVLRMIGAPRNPYPGFYLFYVSDDKITFVNYQSQGGFTRLT